MATLKEHIASDPDARGYSGMSDQAVADDLNTLRRNGTREVDIEQMADISFNHARAWMNALKQAQDIDPGTFAEAGMCQALFVQLSNKMTMKVGSSWITNISAAMAASGTVTEWQAANDTALGNFVANTVTDGQFYGFGRVKVGHVEQARA